MKKYRLIKEYPGHPIKLNTTLNCEKDDNDNYQNYNIPVFNVNQYPEFWEEVVEKDYEILSFRRNKNSKYEDTQFNLTPGDLYNPLFKISNLTLEHCLNGGFDIWKVKRLSDGKVFTVGDYVRPKKCKHNGFNITGFTLNYNDEDILALGGNGGININKINLYNKPLFTTEDGIDIFEGDKFWYVNNIKTNGYCLNESDPTKPSDYKKVSGIKDFSTKEAAEEYILMNKPSLCINDVINSLEFSYSVSMYENIKKFKANLTKLVK